MSYGRARYPIKRVFVEKLGERCHGIRAEFLVVNESVLNLRAWNVYGVPDFFLYRKLEIQEEIVFLTGRIFHAIDFC